MIVERLVVNAFQENTYLVGDEEGGRAFVVDPGGENDRLLALAAERGLSIECILNTHGHIDHVLGAAELQRRLAVPFRMHEADGFIVDNLRQTCALYGLPEAEPPRLDEPLRDGEIVELGALRVEVIHTPGHSPGGCCLLVDGHLFAGDTLFAGSIGRTDFPGGDYETLMRSIRERLIDTLPPATVLHCGHGPESTLADELAGNPFLS